jgi:FimV-like protein
MIEIILKSYFTILLSIGLGAIFIFIFGLYFIFRKVTHTPTKSAQTPITTTIRDEAPPSKDNLTAITGDDIIGTQLDLARAYIETGKKQLAKKILHAVAKQHSASHEDEIKRLLSYL